MSAAATRGFVRGTERDRGCERVAMFLLQVGAPEAARVLPYLHDEEVVGIVREVVRTNRLEQREAARIMEEFGYGRSAAVAEIRGGAAAARRLLRAAFTEKRTAELLRLGGATCGHAADGSGNDGNGTTTRSAPDGERRRGAPKVDE